MRLSEGGIATGVGEIVAHAARRKSPEQVERELHRAVEAMREAYWAVFGEFERGDE